MILIQLIGFACLAHLVTDFAQWLELPQKPFQCGLCMGWWLSILPLTIQWGAMGLLYAAITGVLSDLIFRTINRV